MKEEILAMLKELRPEHPFAESADFIEDGLLDSFDIDIACVSYVNIIARIPAGRFYKFSC